MNIRYVPVATLILLACIGLFAVSESAAQGKGRSQVMKGNEFFQQGKFDEAMNEYQDAKVDNPTSPIIDYNIANTLYEKRKFEEALKLYDQVLRNTDDPMLQAKTYYNMGNALYRMNKLPESILAYQEALKLNPGDEDAKYNLEYVRAKLKQEAQKQPMQHPPQQQQQQQQQQQNPQNQEKNQQQEQQQQQQEQLQQQEDQQQTEQQEQPEKEQQINPEEISKEDAERILNALQNHEKDLQKARKMKMKGRRRSSKDW